MTHSLIQTHLTVMTWNLWWQFGPWQDRAPAILQSLKDIDADLIGLQEVWDDRTTNFAAQLAGDLGYHHAYAPGARPNGVYMGNAILSRWPISRQDIAPLYDQKGAEEMRVVLFCEIDGPRGAIPMFSTHLNWQFHHSHIRQKQVGDLARFVAQHKSGPVPPIICGDFNADPQSDEIRMMTGQTTVPVENLVFHDAWADTPQTTPGYSWDNANPYVGASLEPNRRIDYIFAGWPGLNGVGHITDCRLAANGPVNGIWPSDHHAVVARLRY